MSLAELIEAYLVALGKFSILLHLLRPSSLNRGLPEVGLPIIRFLILVVEIVYQLHYNVNVFLKDFSVMSGNDRVAAGVGFELKPEEQVWSLTQFYSVDFSQSRIGVKKCVFNKRTIKVCVN